MKWKRMAQGDAFREWRERMVDEQLRGRDITDRRVLEAMRDVPRHFFVPEDSADLAYIDAPLPIGYRQTISQPYIVALMTQLLRLRGDETVLEVGTGSGYQAAVLGRLARRVYSVERIPELAETARLALARLNLDNVEVRNGDATRLPVDERQGLRGRWLGRLAGGGALRRDPRGGGRAEGASPAARPAGRRRAPGRPGRDGRWADPRALDTARR
jgi:tRNA/tmRNA/rRNA uracil-C5-methylase (TrmA/RlmC/RlmD family)